MKTPALIWSVCLVFCAACGEGGAEVSDIDPADDTAASLVSPNRSMVVGETLPATLDCGKPATATVSFRNMGNSTWTSAAGFKLGAAGDFDPLYGRAVRVLLGQAESIAPGQTATFKLLFTAPTKAGTYSTDWQMLVEGVEWFGATLKKDVVVACSAPPAPVTLCSGVTADNTGRVDASTALQRCVDGAAGTVLEIPAGTYRMDSQLHIRRNLILRTHGLANWTVPCMVHQANCATLQASADFQGAGGIVVLENTREAGLDHIVLDGNRAMRLESAAAASCATGNNRAGFNASATNCTHCWFQYGASLRALCGTGFEWSGDEAVITDNVFRDNGDHAQPNMAADGLTLLHSDNAVVRGNSFTDNSSIGFTTGGAMNAIITNNNFWQTSQPAYAALMLNNFNGRTSGDFRGAAVSENSIRSESGLLGFGIVAGPHAWYLSRNIVGGTLSHNTIVGTKVGINVDGAGTVANPIRIFGNTASGSPLNARFSCGARQTSNFNIAPDAIVDRDGERTPVATNYVWHQCP